MATMTDRCGCTSMQDCHHPLCRYQEPHRHGFDCDKTCGCGGKGYDVIDPENHPKHVEWRMQRDHERETER